LHLRIPTEKYDLPYRSKNNKQNYLPKKPPRPLNISPSVLKIGSSKSSNAAETKAVTTNTNKKNVLAITPGIILSTYARRIAIRTIASIMPITINAKIIFLLMGSNFIKVIDSFR
jgi:hypothetical protein